MTSNHPTTGTNPVLEADMTRLLQAAGGGDSKAFDRIFGIVYQELRRLARVVRRNRSGQTLNTTALVHEAYVKLAPSANLDWQDRVHFFRVAARAMRQVLVDAAERSRALKRGPDRVEVTLRETLAAKHISPDDILALDEALEQLETFAPRQAQIVEWRIFGGLTIDETARALDLSAPTVKRQWRLARAWLTCRLGESPSVKTHEP